MTDRSACPDIVIQSETNDLLICTSDVGDEPDGCSTECFDFSDTIGTGGSGESGDSCAAGLTPCGSSCVNLQTDPTNCGVCNGICTASSICVAGVCACQAGLVDCSGVCTNVQSDPLNCGACGNPCGAGDVCTTGFCASSG